MRFQEPLVPATFVRRRKRFLVDVLLDGVEVTVHCPNSGSMRTCLVEGARVWISRASNPKRKLPWTLEISCAGEGEAVPCLVNTARPNALVEEAIRAERIPLLAGYPGLRREVPYGSRRSRIDLLLEAPDRPPCHVEVKNVTLVEEPGVARFPDAVTARGLKHLLELEEVVAAGGRGVIFFLVSRGDAERMGPADHIDPAYGEALRSVMAAGVEAMAWRLDVSPQRLELERPLPIIT